MFLIAFGLFLLFADKKIATFNKSNLEHNTGLKGTKMIQDPLNELLYL